MFWLTVAAVTVAGFGALVYWAGRWRERALQPDVFPDEAWTQSELNEISDEHEFAFHGADAYPEPVDESWLASNPEPHLNPPTCVYGVLPTDTDVDMSRLEDAMVKPLDPVIVTQDEAEDAKWLDWKAQG